MTRAFACLVAAATLLVAGVAGAQTTSSAEADSVEAAPPPAKPSPSKSGPSRVYYGGAIGFNFWNDYTQLSIEPLVAYKVNPKLSVGGRVRYEYFNDKRSAVDFSSHNYGGSVFSRYRVVPMLYGHAEYAYMSYDFIDGREGVPFLYLGGGYSTPMGPRGVGLRGGPGRRAPGADKSPYEDWDPAGHGGGRGRVLTGRARLRC